MPSRTMVVDRRRSPRIVKAGQSRVNMAFCIVPTYVGAKEVLAVFIDSTRKNVDFFFFIAAESKRSNCMIPIPMYVYYFRENQKVRF